MDAEAVRLKQLKEIGKLMDRAEMNLDRAKVKFHEVYNAQVQNALGLATTNKHAAVRRVFLPTLSDGEFTEEACAATAQLCGARLIYLDLGANAPRSSPACSVETSYRKTSGRPDASRHTAIPSQRGPVETMPCLVVFR